MAIHLPDDTGWMTNPALLKLVAALEDGGDGPRIVGGAIRDTLLGLPVSDIDIATKLPPQSVLNQLNASGIKAVPTGLDHGTITAVIDKQNFEITTLRLDIATDGRRATIAFATEWKDDAARRDFTINALYADPNTGKVFDYFGGLADIETRTVRFIGDPAQRIAEDHLRILRYFRFLARFSRDGEADPAAVAACKNAANSLMALSRERIAQELSRLLLLPDPHFAIGLMVENGIFAPFLPELIPEASSNFARLVECQSRHNLPATLPSRLLAILPENADVADKVAMRLKFSNRIRVELADRLKERKPDRSNIRALAYHVGIVAAQDTALLRCTDPELADCLELIDNWTVPEFPIGGGHLIAKGLRAGPIIAQTLKSIERHWIASGFPDGSELQTIADQLIAGALSASK